MLRTNKTTAKKRANRGLAFIRGIQRNHERSIEQNGTGGKSPLKPLQMSQMSSQGFGNQGSSLGGREISMGLGFGGGHKETGKAVRISSVPRFVTAADSLAVIKGETSNQARKRLWNMCSSEPAVRGFKYFDSSTSTGGSVMESSPASKIGMTSKYFETPGTSRSTGDSFVTPGAGVISGRSDEAVWNPFKRPNTVFQTPWITRGDNDRFEIQSNQENVEGNPSDASIHDMIESMYEDDEEQNIEPFF
ncbi:unnamed protein product [Allacma fusca]|uniref:Uncharacterized protein n=1 Tax=Allacma fusca TaxID=39272 RepID=A0A8J2M6I2_9HEXA|nr:unnamed protein product [Allacma fusca]